MNSLAVYYHRQHAPLCWTLYVLAIAFLIIAGVLINVPAQSFVSLIFIVTGGVTLILAASFHHLTVAAEIDRLSISFGPLPLFRRTVKYDQIISASMDRTTLLEGWGIHPSPRGGWIWNLWGRDCIKLQLQRGTLRVGTDDAENLVAFVNGKLLNGAAV
ncbi:MAG: hypothetical protein QM501_04200 [Gimesia sp.]